MEPGRLCTCTYVCMYVYVEWNKCVQKLWSLVGYVCVCIFACMHVCMYMHVCVYVYIHIYIYMYIYIYIYMQCYKTACKISRARWEAVYVCTRTHTHTFVCTHTHTHTHLYATTKFHTCIPAYTHQPDKAYPHTYTKHTNRSRATNLRPCNERQDHFTHAYPHTYIYQAHKQIPSSKPTALL
jgi:hypothetical protein